MNRYDGSSRVIQLSLDKKLKKEKTVLKGIVPWNGYAHIQETFFFTIVGGIRESGVKQASETWENKGVFLLQRSSQN